MFLSAEAAFGNKAAVSLNGREVSENQKNMWTACKTAGDVYKRQIVYTRTAAKDMPKLKAAHLDDKAKQLISILKQNPYQSPPSYEKLTGDLQGLYSRRINVQHRLVYEVLEDAKTVKIVSLWTHYDKV